MVPALKIPYAERNGALIHVSEVPSGLQADCFCPACKGKLIARKGQQIVHHFAHYGDTNCQPETVAHLTAKRLLADRMRKAISEHQPVPVQWPCTKCGDTHQGNLVKQVARVETECSLPGCRPDIVLFKPDDSVLAIVEIIVTHWPGQNVRDYCSANKITLLDYQVRSIEDLEQLHSGVISFPHIPWCLRLKCPACHAILARRHLLISKIPCWKCRASMQIAHLKTDNFSWGPAKFTPDEIALAEKWGVCLKRQHSAKEQLTYLANTCRRCGAFLARRFEFPSWGKGTHVSSLMTSYSCLRCDYRHLIALPDETDTTPTGQQLLKVS